VISSKLWLILGGLNSGLFIMGFMLGNRNMMLLSLLTTIACFLSAKLEEDKEINNSGS
jgi:hypothetical protein|tara:strand:+ start:230 stop:403 length:174 start_codon:yes stop_codon:yes gene_type:complete